MAYGTTLSGDSQPVSFQAKNTIAVRCFTSIPVIAEAEVEGTGPYDFRGAGSSVTNGGLFIFDNGTAPVLCVVDDTGVTGQTAAVLTSGTDYTG